MIVDRGRGRRLNVRTADGLTLYARVSEAKKSRACAVLCHGITSDCREDGLFTRFARKAPGRGLSCVRFDFRGHGKSEGAASEFDLSGQRRDLDAVLDLTGELDLGPRILVGMSFGASAAAAAAVSGAPRIVPALALFSPVVDYAALARSPGDVRLSPELTAECEADPTAETLASTSLPVLAFATPADRVVPYAGIAEAARRNRGLDLREVPGGRHGLQGSHRRVVEETLDWIEERL